MHENLPSAKHVRVAIFLLRKNIAGASNGFDGAHKVRWTLALGGPERSGDREA